MLVGHAPGAKFSPDRKYRYLLTRQLGFGDGAVMFLMLNPSTADETRKRPDHPPVYQFREGLGLRLAVRL